MKENVTWTTSLTTQQRDTGAVDHTHTTGDTVVGGRNGADYSGLKLKSLLPSSLYLKIVYKFISIFTGLRLGVVREAGGGFFITFFRSMITPLHAFYTVFIIGVYVYVSLVLYGFCCCRCFCCEGR